MIRREVLSADGRGEAWLLISQIDHAHLAFEVAKHWGAPGFEPLADGDQLLWAIEHHDDGWHDWEQSPDVEPDNQAPRSFTEMEVPDSLAIWSGSIVVASRGGPLAGYVVAGHFAALAHRFVAPGRQTDRRAVDRFLAVQDDFMARSLASWQAIDPTTNTAPVARLALAQLQFFDLLSLWFCCGESTEAEWVEPPRGPELTLDSETPSEIRLTPWPLTVDRLDLEVPARRVPHAAYRDRRELADAPSQSVQLRRALRAGG